MTAWISLLAASQLLAGTAWDLITHPRIGGPVTIHNDGIAVSVADTAVTAVVSTSLVQVDVGGGVDAFVKDASITASYQTSPVATTLAPGPIQLEIPK